MSKVTRLPAARSRIMHSHTRGVMNRTEARYEAEMLSPKRLTGEISWYWFESLTLKLAAGSRYTPDFVVQLSDGTLECHEVKGTQRSKTTGVSSAYFPDGVGRTKLAVAASQWPFRFLLVWWDKQTGWQQKEVNAD